MESLTDGSSFPLSSSPIGVAATLAIGAGFICAFVMSKRSRGLFYTTAPHAPTGRGFARPKLSPKVKTAEPRGYQLIDELIANDTILEAIRHMPAAVAVRLSRTSHAW